MTAPYLIAPLGPGHDRKRFCCGVAALDRYFHDQVTQDVRRRATACYVATEAVSGRVAGYYTLAASGIRLDTLPDAVVKRLPRYPSVPVARLGRLAVAEAERGKGLGGVLLWDAAARAAQSGLGVFALVVDAKDALAAAFYAHHGFVPFAQAPRQLFLPLGRVAG